MHRRLRKLGFIFILALMAPFAYAEMPSNWPWRGVVLESPQDTNEQDIEYLASIGVNAVHLFPGVRRIAKSKNIPPRKAWEYTIAWLDRMLDASKKHGITAIIDMSQFPIDPSLDITQVDPRFWNSDQLKLGALMLIGELAAHMKNRGSELAAYQFFSEPLVLDGGRQNTPESWRWLASKIIEVIRRNDPQRYVVITPGFGSEASYFKDYEPLPYEKIIYCVHVYNPHPFTHQGVGDQKLGLSYPGLVGTKYWDHNELISLISPVVEFKKKHNALIWVGEFSALRWAEGGDKYVEELVDIFDDYGLSWSYYSYQGYHGWNPFYSKEFSTDRRADWASKFVGKNTPRWQMLLRKFGKSPLKNVN